MPELRTRGCCELGCGRALVLVLLAIRKRRDRCHEQHGARPNAHEKCLTMLSCSPKRGDDRRYYDLRPDHVYPSAGEPTAARSPRPAAKLLRPRIYGVKIVWQRGLQDSASARPLAAARQGGRSWRRRQRLWFAAVVARAGDPCAASSQRPGGDNRYSPGELRRARSGRRLFFPGGYGDSDGETGVRSVSLPVQPPRAFDQDHARRKHRPTALAARQGAVKRTVPGARSPARRCCWASRRRP